MASQTLRPHRSPSPSPSPTSTPVNPSNPAKLTRQSLGPPPTVSASAARGFSGLGITGSPGLGGSHPRHVSSSVALGFGGGRESLSPRPTLGSGGSQRAVSGSAGRPSSEFLPGLRGESRTPESEQMDQWFQHLANWENTLEEMAAASTDQNFTEELSAIEQWFRVLSEAERTAALYSLLQHSTPVQIRFFMSVLHHMSQSDPMSAILSPNPAASFQAQMDPKLAGMNLKSPSAGGGSGFAGSPTVNQFLAPEAAVDTNSNKSRLRQNRISAPGTLQPTDRWTGHLDQVIERGTSPGMESNASTRSRSPGPDPRPKSTDFGGPRPERSPRLSGGIGLGIGAPDATSPMASPFLNNSSWASMVNTPLAPMFTDPKVDNLASALQMANSQLNQTRVALEDARRFRRPGASTARNVSGQYNDDGELINPNTMQPGRAASPLVGYTRSPVLDQYGLGGLGMGNDNALAGLGMNFANLGLGGLPNANTAQMLALAQAQQQINAAQYAGYGAGALGPLPRGDRKMPPGRKSPMLGKSQSPTPDRNVNANAGGGGAGGGAGVAGPDDVDMRILEDVSSWLRVLRLHKYTTNFEKSNWREMVLMTDSDLQAKGVSAQGARTKFLKVFYNVRQKEGIAHPDGQEEFAPTSTKDDK
ncbi:hypothetical protein BCR39DRAFT_532534 [Naematelia encephala]|uniref:SAM domain-containing protein n=1 Tax=Naematelia encephala TaxID=71784 RepID=A0A1Y2B3H1_9TREE|nr:hypothetical protein BCR39DRAFT_532534 [Naematelia encephala]